LNRSGQVTTEDVEIFKTVAEKVTNVAKKLDVSRKRKFHFTIDASDEGKENAFATKHSKVGVGLEELKTAKENRLGFLVGHELAHNLLLHTFMMKSTDSLRDDYLKEILYSLLKIPVEEKRKREEAADKLGVMLAILAGYDSEGGIEYFEARLEKYPESDFDSTHPSYSKRIAYLKELVAQLKGLSQDELHRAAERFIAENAIAIDSTAKRILKKYVRHILIIGDYNFYKHLLIKLHRNIVNKPSMIIVSRIFFFPI